MLILLRGGRFHGAVIEDEDPPDVFIVNQKNFYKKTDRGDMVEVEKGYLRTAIIYEIDFSTDHQSIQWDLPGLNVPPPEQLTT